METEELNISRVHHGRNIRRTRIEKNINQDTLGEMIHLSQPAICKYENTRVIDDEMLKRFAKALNVPFEYLKTLEEDAPIVIFENITNNENAGAYASIGHVGEDNRVNNLNPLDKVTELYERLLKEKDEKYAALERRLESLQRNTDK